MASAILRHHGVLVKCALSAALACTGATAWAQEATEEAQPNALWINIGALTYHPENPNAFNGNNRGFGVEYRVRPDVSLVVGTYYNSVYRDTNYAAVNWQPLQWGDWKLGLAMGVLNGYPAVEKGGYFPAALPMLSYEGRRFGANFSVIPTLPQVDAALVFQLKLRLN